MKMQDVRTIAKGMGINTGAKRTKQDLILEIQTKEGNIPC